MILIVWFANFQSLVVIREFQKSLTNKFPKVKLACEPGNLLAEKAGDLYVKVMSKRAVKGTCRSKLHNIQNIALNHMHNEVKIFKYSNSFL